MIKRLAVFNPIERNGWIFRASISNEENIMLMCFGPEGQYLHRFFNDDLNARAFVEECALGKHVEE